jgi:hypothetical protein
MATDFHYLISECSNCGAEIQTLNGRWVHSSTLWSSCTAWRNGEGLLTVGGSRTFASEPHATETPARTREPGESE